MSHHGKSFISKENEKIQDRIRYSKLRDYIKRTKFGGCTLCGYGKCLEALEFHHINTNKEIELSNIKRSIPKAKKEVAKCIIVCSNCHREIHSGQIEAYDQIETRVVKELPMLKIMNGGG